MARRRGFTVIELLTVVAIVGVLVGLLLPAIQSVRESVRRTHCQNNLFQLGVAMGNYASTHHVLPPGVVESKGPILYTPRGYHVGWAVQILPFVEQGNMYRRYDFRYGVYSASNSTAIGTGLNLYLCPSSLLGAMNYAGCHHDAEAPIDADNHGVLYLNSHVGYDDIADGPAYTILLGETEGGAVFSWASGTRDTLRNTGTPINSPDPNAMVSPNTPPTLGQRRDEMAILTEEGGIPMQHVGGFSSRHGLGANFLFCDGSVRFLKEAIEPIVYRRLGHRADGEIISGAQY
jgi:prepilin-type N-terminal cleavage/methylation domain-containing protein/prepilin-type processing-associated H-X9-DG protein